MATSIIKSPRFIVEKGSASGARWIKWSDGTAEYWGWKSGNVSATWLQWGSIYYSSTISRFVYPTNLFIEQPYSVTNITNLSADAWLCFSKNGGTNAETSDFYLVRPTATSEAYRYALSNYSYGRWQ